MFIMASTTDVDVIRPVEADAEASRAGEADLRPEDILSYLKRHNLGDVATAFEAACSPERKQPRKGVVTVTEPDAAAAASTTSSDDARTAPATAPSHGKHHLGFGLKLPLTGPQMSPTPAKPMDPNKARIPPLDSDVKESSARADSADAAADDDDEVEEWDPREAGVISVPGTEADLWQLFQGNLAPRFPHGAGLSYRQYMKHCEEAPTVARVPTRPYQKSPPPSDLPLESFDLRVIYEAGRTGFEECKDFPIPAGTVIAGRYQVTEYLGSAAFSRAVQCVDLKHNAQVCVKIIRNSKDFFDQSLDEVKLLLFINSKGDADENHVLQLYDYFYHKEHMFLVCELLRDNLYEFAKYNREQEPERYFTLPRVRMVARQVLTALQFVHSLGLLHCDLKPENILIKSYSRCMVKVIDFGSSCYTTDSLSSYVQSRCYRAPEVVLGCPYDGGIDVWSLGAILPELMTGNVLFHNDTLGQMLARIAAICGPFPESMLHAGRHTSAFVTEHGAFYEYPSTELDGHKTTGELTFHFPRPTRLEHLAGDADPAYIDFLRQCLTIDPAKRPSAAELLQHPFILAEESTSPTGSPTDGTQVAGAASPRSDSTAAAVAQC